MKKYWNHRVSFWLRIIVLFCGILVNVSIINNYRNVSSDFVVDYIAANSLWRGNSVYGEDIKNLENEMLGFHGPPTIHPPFNAVLFLPLSFFDYKTAFVVLDIVSLILLLLINQLVVRGLELNKEWFVNLTCFSLYWYPVFYCLGTGQSSMIIAACLVSGWFCLRFKKAYIAGFLFAIATLMKLFPGLVLLYLLISKNWRTFFATVFFIVLGLSLTTLIVGLDDMRTYSNVIVGRFLNEWSGFVLNHSLNGVITRLFGEGSGWAEPLIQLPRIKSLLIILLNSAILIFTTLKMRGMTVKQELVDHAFGLTIVTMLLLSPITWGHIFPVLILPLSILLRDYIRKPSSRKLRILLFIILLLSLPDVLIAKALMAMHHPFIMPWYSMLLTLGPSAGLVLLWIVLMRSSSVGRVRQTP
ncbi:DUF2029 domain-containing protein [Candidatus Babeliales bacterium]|nr:DUF2029 domain-containing protein [Candidatus Babeliales bacterium]